MMKIKIKSLLYTVSFLFLTPTVSANYVHNFDGGLHHFDTDKAEKLEEGYYYLISAQNGAEVHFKDGSSLIDIGSLISSYNSNLVFGNNITISDNNASGGTIEVSNSKATFGNNVVFKNNKSHMGGVFTINEGSVKYGNNITFDNNFGQLMGGVMYVSSSNVEFGNNIVISNNLAGNAGVAYLATSLMKFGDNVKIVNNSTREYGRGGVFMLISASKVDFGNNILIENNKADGKLNSFHFGGRWQDDDANTINFNLTDGYANIRDPMISDDEEAIVNLNGNGRMLLWGDNNEYLGKMNINGGSFYLMFEDTQKEEDSLGQRLNGKLENSYVNFADNTIYRPMLNNNKLASLNSDKTTVGNSVTLLPYNLSKLDVGQYSYDNDYSKFESWESDLAKVDTSDSSGTSIEIKRDLEGYKNLSSLADIMRKREDLSWKERDDFDNLYMTGEISDGLSNLMDVVKGNDFVDFNYAKKSSLTTFNKQINSRIHNKDCDSCGRSRGFKDEHLWFSVSQSWIDKKTTSESLGYKYTPTSIAIGYDFDAIPRELKVGATFGYSFGEAKTKSGEVTSTNDIKEYLVALYAKYQPMKAYVSGSVGAGIIDNESNFIGNGVDTKADYRNEMLFANTEIGYNFGNEITKIEPYIGIEYAHIHSDKYKEKGIGARQFDSMNWNTFETPIGVRISNDIVTENNIFTPSLDLAYAYNFGDNKIKTEARFLGNMNQSWQVVSNSEERGSYRGAVNFKVNNLNYPFALNFGYSINYNSDYKNNQIYGTIRWDF